MGKRNQTSLLGKQAEYYAVKLLVNKGYQIIQRNFKSKFGEIDIIAQKDQCLIFVEVKARWGKDYGKPEEAVTPSKLWKISKTGEYFSLLNPNLPQKLRIDVVALEIDGTRVNSAKIINVDWV